LDEKVTKLSDETYSYLYGYSTLSSTIDKFRVIFSSGDWISNSTYIPSTS